MENINEIYCNLEGNFKILKFDNYKGYNYQIITYGTHPCCYIEIPENHSFYNLSIIDNYNNALMNIKCHGGITFAQKTDDLFYNKGIYAIGWDYAHAGDYFHSEYMENFYKKHDWRDFQKYNLEHLIKDTENVIEQIIEMIK